MKTKNNFRWVSHLGICACLLLSANCSKNDEKLSDLTGITTFGFTDDVVKDYSFTVDNIELKIENLDSLPYQFNVADLTAKFDVIEGSSVSINGAAQQSGISKNDFSDVLTYTVVAEDGVTTKNYTVQVNVAKLNPEGLQWKHANPNAFDPAYDTKEYFSLNGKYFVVAGKTGMSESKLYSSADGKTWKDEQITGAFPLGFNHNIVVRDGTAYVVGYLEMSDPYGLGNPAYYQKTLGENLYYTTDGLTWSKIDGALVSGSGWSKVYNGRINTPAFNLDNTIYAVGGNTSVFGSFTGGKPADAIFYPPAGVSPTTLISTDGSAYVSSANYSADMPKRVYASSYIYQDKMYIAGGLGLDGANLSDVWSSTDGVNWTMVSDGAFSARQKASTVVYDNKVWMIGGLLSDGTCTAEILVSEDGGINWTQVGEEKALPGDFAARCNAEVSLDQDGNLWIIGGEYTEVTTDGNGNQVISYKPLSDVWTGKLNKL